MQTPLSNNYCQSPNKRLRRSEGGFSLLEMLVAMVLITIGLLGVASAISYALLASNSGRSVTNAKMLIVSILEQMETLRDTGQLHFNEISNSQVVGSTFTGFPSTFQPVSTMPGPDGVFGTADDLINAGPDGVYGTADDFSDPTLARPGVTRQILISTLPDNDYLKKIQVTLRYSVNGSMTELVCYGYLNDNEHGNYIP
ncbi:MAG TPA: prepilin-type N-terminal cleavage/methylation domain-containing protein [Pyrinomonadaceae bacterium]